uniref:Uncharacterized protein n=1 Tax=Plectus sambesii TaxID=2011161 RepID=A0A914VJC8_9BILA
EDVCSAPTQSHTITATEEKRGCLSLSVPVFEMAHLCTYQPDFISVYCRLSTFLDHFTLILQSMLRRTLKDEEIRLYKEQMDALNIFQQRLDDIWKSARWITNVASNARDRHINCGLPLGVLFAYSEVPETTSDNPEEAQSDHSDPDVAEDNSDVGYHSDQSIDKAGSSAPIPIVPSVSVQAAIANPTYDFPNVAENSASVNSNSMYVNLQSTGGSNAWCSTPT